MSLICNGYTTRLEPLTRRAQEAALGQLQLNDVATGTQLTWSLEHFKRDCTARSDLRNVLLVEFWTASYGFLVFSFVQHTVAMSASSKTEWLTAERRDKQFDMVIGEESTRRSMLTSFGSFGQQQSLQKSNLLIPAIPSDISSNSI